MSSVSTRKGDDGQTAILGKERMPKSSSRIVALGSIDELAATLGVAHAFCTTLETRANIKRAQLDLFRLGTSLATPLEEKDRTKEELREQLRTLDECILSLEARHATRHYSSTVDRYIQQQYGAWLVPGDTVDASLLHLARTVCRRAETSVVALKQQGNYVNECVLAYLNRLSDLLWVLARELEK
jgi:cob(I)alamin adenosyltransferase